LGAFLDIEGPFDNTSFSAVVKVARECGLEETCCRWIGSMLASRLIHTSLMGSSLTARVLGGYPQGGVLSLLLWNLVVDGLLAVMNDQGFSTFGNADDIVIIVQGKFAHTLRELMQEAMNMVDKWTAKEGLNISPHKTPIAPFTNRRKTESLRLLTLHGKQLQILGEVKYLGVILDSKLNWNQHMQKTISMVHGLYTRVIRPSIFHGALVWWSRVTPKNHQNSIRQDSENGLPGYYRGYEFDPHYCDGGAFEPDSVRSADHGGGKNGTPQAAHTQATSCF
jgi:hypothetical protein